MVTLVIELLARRRKAQKVLSSRCVEGELYRGVVVVSWRSLGK